MSTSITTNTIHAPCVNLVTVTMTSTDAVMSAPSALIARPRHTGPAASERSRSTRIQRRTMPIWPSVNEMNTPMMYSWMSVVTFACAPTSSTGSRSTARP